jgi:hypothetical protein
MKQKKSSTISAKQALQALMDVGYTTHEPEDRRIRPTERANHKKTPGVQLSASGKSICLFFNGESNELARAPQIFVPAKGMLSQNEVTGLEQRARIKFSELVR